MMAKGAGQLTTNDVAVFPILRKTKCIDESQTFCTSKKPNFSPDFFRFIYGFWGLQPIMSSLYRGALSAVGVWVCPLNQTITGA